MNKLSKKAKLLKALCVIIPVLSMSLNVTAENSQTSKKQSKKVDNHWIVNAKDDQQRFARIETYLRGFDQPMWEVGDRFEQMVNAVDRNNYPLAAYHWKKIKKTIVNGIVKRPGRSASAKQFLLANNWQLIMQELNKKTPQSAQIALQQAAAICMACHAAEGVGFVNDQSLFDRFQQK